MRKGLFAIGLVAAAFAGGATVNGPGLNWARELILKLSPPDDSAEPADEPITGPTVGAVAAPEGSTSTAPAPSSVAASEKSEPARGKKERKKRTSEVRAKPLTEPKAPEPSEAQPADYSSPKNFEPKNEAHALLPGGETPAATASTSTPPAELKAPAPLEGLPPLEMSAPLPASSPMAPSKEAETKPQPTKPEMPKREEAIAKSSAPDPAWPDAPGSAPAAAVPPRPQSIPGDRDPAIAPASTAAEPSVAAPQTSSTGSSSDWAELRRQMRELGVSRYGIEGEPAGRVRFHCVIPLAGRRAVGQQFEADGDDEIQAARTALRRVALWRATENPGP